MIKGSAPQLPPPASLGLPAKFKSYHPTQSQAVIDITDSTKSTVIINAPTGTGKGAIAATVGVLEGARVLVLTATKMLQDVYHLDYASMGMCDVRGANNYPCPALLPGGQFAHLNVDRDPDPRADKGPCLSGLKCHLRSGGCPRYDNLEVAKRAPMVVTNYDCWLAIGKSAASGGSGPQKGSKRGGNGPPSDDDGGGGLGQFDYIFLDELHSCSSKVGDAMRIELDPRQLSSVLEIGHMLTAADSIGKWVGWAHEMSRAVMKVWDEIRADIKGSAGSAGVGINAGLMKELREVQRVYQLVSAMTKMHDGWIVDSKYGSNNRIITFEPVWPGEYCEQLLFRGIPHRVGMSATIRPAALKYIGLKHADSYDYFEYDSPFPVANRPVYQWPAVQLNYKTEKLLSTQRLWSEAIDKLREDRGDRKGIGHSISYGRMERYAMMTEHRGNLITHSKHDIKQQLNVFNNMDDDSGAFMFSPAIDTGYDFPGAKARYNIISKTPYPPMDTAIMRARVKSDPMYPNVYAADKITQMAGRTNRSVSDWSEIIITDSSVGALFRDFKLFAKWFRRAWKFTREAPRPMRRVRS